MSIIISGMSFHYYNQPILFQNISLSVMLGRKISVVGNNGIGKSTLLKLIAGKLNVSSRSIQCSYVPYYIPQQINIIGLSVGKALGVSDKIEALHAIYEGSDDPKNYEILDDDWDIESRYRIALDDWSLSGVEMTTPIDTLSGGEKAKVFLAGIAIQKPRTIILDEPTNHLDYTSRQKLYDIISRTKATVIVVSHDVTLLNLLDETYELSPDGLKLYGGNYNFYKEQKSIEEQALNQQINAEETALKLLRRKAKEVSERQEKRSRQAERNKGQVIRILRQGLKNSGENSCAKLKDKHTEIIHQNSQRLSDLRQKQEAKCELNLNFDNTLLYKGKLLVSANRLNFRYSEANYLWKDALDIEIRSRERIHLKGDNGTGKTTLLKLLIGELAPSVGKIIKSNFSFVYLDQEYSSVNTSQHVLEMAQQYNSHNLLDHEIKLRLHRALFSKDMWDKPCNVLSGGEKMRLSLCCLMISNHIPDLIILDEPTNNLDLQSLDILMTTIKNYTGTLLITSHDESFVQEISITRVIELKTDR
jgi:ATPase subunit of ABC transporter with duplicated ATPase domains